MKNLEEFYEEVLKSKDLQKEFASCKKEEDIYLFFKKNDCDAKVEDVQKFLQEKFTKEGKANDLEVSNLSGGCSSDTAEALVSTFRYVGIYQQKIFKRC